MDIGRTKKTINAVTQCLWDNTPLYTSVQCSSAVLRERILCASESRAEQFVVLRVNMANVHNQPSRKDYKGSTINRLLSIVTESTRYTILEHHTN